MTSVNNGGHHGDGNVEPEGGWRQHMHLDGAGRQRKAHKLVTLVGSHVPLAGARILDIGTGTGFIASELSRAAGPDGTVTSIDVMDTRLLVDGYTFVPISGTALPFAADSFDLVVSNHVIEHVGPGESRQHHLDEIARVLAPGGACYLATPSRWAPMEPHFKVPLLSWPPQAWRSRYLRLTRRGTLYDVHPLGPRELDRAATSAGLTVTDISASAVTAALGENGRARRGLTRLVRQLPGPIWRLLSRVMPTHVRLLSRR